MKISAFVTILLLLLVAPMEAAGATRGSRVREIDFIEEDPKRQSYRQLQSLDDKKLDFEIKKRVCEEIGKALDAYYGVINKILNRATRVSSQIEFLCKNANIKDPGLRDTAFYTRFDYFEKCKQAEQAQCEIALETATATKATPVLLRKLTGQVIEFKMVKEADVAKEVKNGFNRVLVYTPMDPSPYMSKSVPFTPTLLNETCGRAGFGYYVDYVVGFLTTSYKL